MSKPDEDNHDGPHGGGWLRRSMNPMPNQVCTAGPHFTAGQARALGALLRLVAAFDLKDADGYEIGLAHRIESEGGSDADSDAKDLRTLAAAARKLQKELGL